MGSTAKKDITVSYRGFLTASLIFLALPVLIFFVFFLKVIPAVIFSLALVLLCIYAVKNAGEREMEISRPLLIGMAVFSLVWAYLAGIGEFTWTTLDHNIRAATLNDLVNYDWPVFYDLTKQSDPVVREAFGDGTVAFAYYFTFWMVPAAAGKVMGLFAARIATMVWGAAGLFLITLGINFMQKKASVTAIVVFFLFGGVDALAFGYKEIVLHMEPTWEGWNTVFNLHGNFYQTMNTFHQSIPGWLITVLLINAVKGKSVGTIGSLMFAYSPWATIGVLPIAIYELINKNRDEKTGKIRIKDVFSPGNLIMSVLVLICYALFYTANSNATGIRGFIWEFYPDAKEVLLSYLFYIIIEFGIWAAVLFTDHRKDGLYYVCLGTLLIMPVYMMSEANDLLMRGTLSPMFVIGVMATLKIDKAVRRTKMNNNNVDMKSFGYFALLFVTGITAILFMITVIGATKDIYTGKDKSVQPKDQAVSFGDLQSHEQYFINVTPRQFYVYDYEDKPFYKYLGKTP